MGLDWEIKIYKKEKWARKKFQEWMEQEKLSDGSFVHDDFRRYPEIQYRNEWS